MNRLAIIGNFAALIFLTFVFIDDRVWKEDAWELLLFVIIYILPIVNLIALFAKRDRKDFFTLFWERKRLEQEKKILELKKEMGKET